MGILHDDEEAVPILRIENLNKPIITITPDGRIRWRDREVETDEAFRAAMLDVAAVWKGELNRMFELRAQLAAAEAERDRYLTRACVAEAKVAEVRELAGSYRVRGNDIIEACGEEILIAIGGKP